MLKAFALLVATLVFTTPALADSIVSWEAFGVTNFQFNQFPGHPFSAPPIGTPWSISLQFDPNARVKTPATSASSPCYMTPVTGSFNLGGTSYSLGSASAFTNSFLPSTNCGVGEPGFNRAPGAIQFSMDPTALAGDLWHLNDQGGPTFLIASYMDLVHLDGTFPIVPTYANPGSILFFSDFFQFGAPFAPRAVLDEQPSPVPEPTTLLLFGTGLAAAWRARRRT